MTLSQINSLLITKNYFSIQLVIKFSKKLFKFLIDIININDSITKIYLYFNNKFIGKLNY